jgi:hypothetical protein
LRPPGSGIVPSAGKGLRALRPIDITEKARNMLILLTESVARPML